MQEEKIKTFFNMGRVLTPEALEFLKDKDIDVYTKGKFDSFIITKDTLENFSYITVLKNIQALPHELTTEDFINFYRTKYEKMKNVILSRVKKDFISLNKVDAQRSEAFVIGTVKDIRDKGDKKVLEIEDPTGSATVIFDTLEDVDIDDTVAIRGIAAGKIIFGKEIIFPDIPIRPAAKGFGKGCFVSDLHIGEAPPLHIHTFFQWLHNEPVDFLFVAGDVGDERQFMELVQQYCSQKKVVIIPGGTTYPSAPVSLGVQNILSLSNPAMVEANGIKVLIIHEFKSRYLKKRHLGDTRRMFAEDYLVMDETPDIIHCGQSHQPHVSNYKSVTIVNSGSPLATFMPVVIDFATRETQQVQL